MALLKMCGAVPPLPYTAPRNEAEVEVHLHL
jgi:hypothetical protein